jgi:hypothetical protein
MLALALAFDALVLVLAIDALALPLAPDALASQFYQIQRNEEA